MNRAPQHSASTAVLRMVRGWLLAISSSVLAVSAHAAADGALPNMAMTFLLTVLIGWVATAVAEQARGLAGMLTTLAFGQGAMHTALTLFSHHDGAGVAIDPLTMTFAHAIATVATAVLLTHTERGLLIAIAALRRLLPVMRLIAPARQQEQQHPSLPIDRPALPTATQIDLHKACARRGPPVRS